MRQLYAKELTQVFGGIDNFSICALKTLGGTIIGGGVGTAVAFSMAVPMTISTFPIWVVACLGTGGAVGSVAGFTFALGGLVGTKHA